MRNVNEVVELARKHTPRVEWLGDAVDDLVLLLFKRAEDAVPDDQHTVTVSQGQRGEGHLPRVVLVDVRAVAAMVHAVVRGRVEDVLQGAHLAHCALSPCREYAPSCVTAALTVWIQNWYNRLNCLCGG